MDKDKDQNVNTSQSQSQSTGSPKPGQSMQGQHQKPDSLPQINQNAQNQQKVSPISQAGQKGGMQQSAPSMGTVQQGPKNVQPQASQPSSTPGMTKQGQQQVPGQNQSPQQKGSAQSMPPQGNLSSQMPQKQTQAINNTQSMRQSSVSQIQQPPPQQPQQDQSGGGDSQSPSVVVSSDSKGGPSKFSLIIGILVIITIIIYAGVAYIYYQNRKLEEEISSGRSQNTAQVQQSTTTPTPPFSPDQVQIDNGSIIRESPGGQTEVLVDKANYESTGITGFISVNVSPDNQLMCFESWSPSPEPAMYLANVNGSNVLEVSPNRRGCSWLQDSQKIVYTNHLREAASVDIYTYDVTANQETNLTLDTQTETQIRQYSIVSITEADRTIQCNYSVINSAGDLVSEDNECVINIDTGQMTDSGPQTT